MVTLTFYEEPPEGLFQTSAKDLHTRLPGPTIARVPGTVEPPVFVSVLLHGNETSGWNALCQHLQEYPRPYRTLIVFIGNVAAAAAGVRSLPQQSDFNRIWKNAVGEEAEMAADALSLIATLNPMAALDIHNNTGRNPHYSVLTEITPESCGLAQLFAETAVFIEEPDTVLTRALQRICPAVTVEAGPVGDSRSDDRALLLLERFSRLESLPTAARSELKLHRSLCRVHLAQDISFDFADIADVDRLSGDDLVLTAGMEGVNFHSVPAGAELGVTRRPLNHVLHVLDSEHQDVSAEYLTEEHGIITLKRSVIPAMYTTDHEVIRQDCLCYFMESFD